MSELAAGQEVGFGDELRDRIARNLASHQRRVASDHGRRRAAVAVVVVDSSAGENGPGPLADASGGAAFLLCRRAARLSAHAAQWALPGGRIDPGEKPEDTARRELAEELGVSLGPEAVLGALDDYPTRSGYVITPVVLWGGGRLRLEPEPAEVAAAYRVGLHELLRADSPQFVSIPESDRPVVQVPLGTTTLHAPTGAVLVQFRWLALDGNPSPVAEFDQPVFAWR